MKQYLALILILLPLLQVIKAEENRCHQCNKNEIACVSKTKFQLCVNGSIASGEEFICPGDTICTTDERICVSAFDAHPACSLEDDSYCGKCARPYPGHKTNKTFACIGADRYMFCEDGLLMENYTINCPVATFCNKHAFEETGHICVPECVITAFKYPTSCSPLEPYEQACLDYEPRLNIECFNIPNPQDPYCSTYIKCKRQTQYKMEAVGTDCVEGFYDPSRNDCVSERPASCKERS